MPTIITTNGSEASKLGVTVLRATSSQSGLAMTPEIT